MVLWYIIQLIRRRYFSNELPAPSPWSLTPREDTILPVETVNDDDMFQRKRWLPLSITDECMRVWWNKHSLCDFFVWYSWWELDICRDMINNLVTLATSCWHACFLTCSYSGQSYKYNGVAPLPAQRNLTPPPTLYPQQPMSSSSENYRYHRFSSSSIPDSSGGRTSRANLNIWWDMWVLSIITWNVGEKTWHLGFLNPGFLIFLSCAPVFDLIVICACWQGIWTLCLWDH